MRWVLFLSVWTVGYPTMTSFEGAFSSEEECMAQPATYHFFSGWNADIAGNAAPSHRRFFCRLVDVDKALTEAAHFKDGIPAND